VKYNEELRLYKIQYTNIQKELERAQTEYDRMAELKRAAEGVATQAKQEVQRISMEREVEKARTEGKMEGLEEGYRRGVQEGISEGQFQEQQRATQAYESVLETSQGRPLQSLAQFAEAYFSGPSSRTRVVHTTRPHPSNAPVDKTRANAPAHDTAPIVDNLPIRAVATPVRQSDVGRQMNDPNFYTAPQSVRNAPVSPVFHGVNIDPSVIPSLDGGHINLPPPHEIDPNPALSPSPSSANLLDSQRTLGDDGDYDYNGTLPLQL
jgi:hypothetical protein